MRRNTVLLAVLGLLLAACGSSDADETTTTTQAAASATTAEAPAATEAPPTTTQPEAAGLVVTVADSSLGSVLVDGEGNTLYLFTPDEQGASVCYDDCATAWPPLTGDVTAGDGVDSGLLGSVSRTDGADQVTYNGWPSFSRNLASIVPA